MVSMKKPDFVGRRSLQRADANRGPLGTRSRQIELPQRRDWANLCWRARTGSVVYAPLADRTIAAMVTEPIFYDKAAKR
jgi:hypothetical protein